MHENCCVADLIHAEVKTERKTQILMADHTPIIRCPYCRVENEFRLLLERVEGWSQCESCGHNAMPLDPEFKCTCSKCATAQLQRFPDSL